jgi:hypothetical protein
MSLSIVGGAVDPDLGVDWAAVRGDARVHKLQSAHMKFVAQDTIPVGRRDHRRRECRAPLPRRPNRRPGPGELRETYLEHGPEVIDYLDRAAVMGFSPPLFRR